jgi:hypothetical protein
MYRQTKGEALDIRPYSFLSLPQRRKSFTGRHKEATLASKKFSVSVINHHAFVEIL